MILQNNKCIREIVHELEINDDKHAIIINENKIYCGQVSISELRRLLISGLSENDIVSSIPLKDASVLKEIYERGIGSEYFDLIDKHNDNLVIVYPDKTIFKVLSINELYQKNHSIKETPIDDLPKKVLLIGGAGYLGTVIVKKLLRKGYNVRILDSFIYGRHSLNNYKDNEKVEIVDGDIRNLETVINALDGVDSVILLAAIVGDPASKLKPSLTIQTNYLASQSVASACKYQQINRFIYASTCSVYGVGENILDEMSPLNPVSLYARTKIASEESILKLSNGNFSPTIMRMSTLYGYSERMRFDLVVNTMTLKAFQEKELTVFGGNQWRPLLHIEDAAEAYIKVLEADIDLVKGKIYNVGEENHNYQIIELANMIKKHFNDTIDVKVIEADVDSRDYRVSFKKIKEELGYNVQLGVIDGVKVIYDKLMSGEIVDPNNRIYYNHFFDFTEEF